MKASKKGVVNVKLKKLKKGTYKLVAKYSGSKKVAPSKTKKFKLKVKK